jgi:hypothetical protein
METRIGTLRIRTLDMYRCREPKDILAASSESTTLRTNESAFGRDIEPVQARSGRIAKHPETSRTIHSSEKRVRNGVKSEKRCQ